MTELHVVSALRAKRAEISGYIHDLEKKVRQQRANLAHIDAAIRVFSPHTDRTDPAEAHVPAVPVFLSRRGTRLCQDVLREAAGPMPAAMIAAALIAAKGLSDGDAILVRHVTDGVLTVMRTLARRGIVVKSGTSRDALWSLAKDGAG